MRSSFALLLCLGACFGGPGLPEVPPALADLEEPLDLLREPDDEAQRQALPAGGFSGLRVDDARDTLAAKLDAPAAVRVAEVVENSPAAAAGLQPDDVLLEVQVADAPPRTLQRPSEWREIELATPPGTPLVLIADRAGREVRTELRLIPRVRPAPRLVAERFREEQRVGIVLRTATEVEARRADLGPGGGAVVVGLSRMSPWRAAGVRFGDLLTAIDGLPVTHPQVVLDAVRDPDKEAVELIYLRGDTVTKVPALLTTRAGTVHQVTIPLLFSYSADRGRTAWSLLLGLLGYESTAAAWEFQFLWLLSFGGGDADQLLEVSR